MKNKKEEILIEQKVIDLPLGEALIDRFNRYAKAVLMERAIPDARDGLKPVQRRIIYTMYLEGNTYTKPTKKSAKTAGAVMGRFHPHGDSSIYEAMVRMSQDFKMRIPLLQFQGNNGSIDGDPAAASRYTEAKLSMASDYLVQDIDKNTVDMALSYDDTEYEPIVLPGRFPNLLVNGAQGIAVGASTSIPPHNLNEVIDATIYRIRHKRTTISDLMQFIKGPDFPTGGILDDVDAIRKIYETGSGNLSMICRTEIVKDKKVNQIIITEIPYGVVKSNLVIAIDKKRIDDKLDNILEVRDESDKDGLRIAIDINPESDPEIILNYLLTKNVIKETLAVNLLAIDKGHPKTMNLLEIIDSFISHQKDVIIRRSQYDLSKNTKRLHILEGLIKAISVVDEVVKIIRCSQNKDDAKQNLMKAYKFTVEQAEAIVMLQLYKLTNTDITVLQNEFNLLREQNINLESILSNEDKLDSLICNDLKAIGKSIGNERKTTILNEKIKVESIDSRSLIAKEDYIVSITKDGYIKKTTLRSATQSKGELPAIKPGDVLKFAGKLSTHDVLLAFTSFGNYFYLPVHEIPDAMWKVEGKHINTISKLDAKEKIVSVIGVVDFSKACNLVFLTKDGQIKKTALIEYNANKLTTKPVRAIRLNPGDELVDVKFTNGNSNLFIVNSNAVATVFNENEVPLVGQKAGGVKAMNQGKDVKPLFGLLPFEENETGRIVLFTNKNYLKICYFNSLEVTGRLGQKQCIGKIFNNNPQTLIGLSKYNKNDEDNKYYIVTKEKDYVSDLSNVETSLLGGGFKDEFDTGKDTPLFVHTKYYQIIDESIVVVKPSKKEQAPTNKENNKVNDTDQQSSLFDLDDDF